MCECTKSICNINTPTIQTNANIVKKTVQRLTINKTFKHFRLKDNPNKTFENFNSLINYQANWKIFKTTIHISILCAEFYYVVRSVQTICSDNQHSNYTFPVGKWVIRGTMHQTLTEIRTILFKEFNCTSPTSLVMEELGSSFHC